ncbi:hypothetical protein N9P57_03040 [Planktomarina temperata]|nr:hypothetical protein [Planktomarina temperata]
MAIKKINTDLQVEAGLRDGDGDLGTNNQVLISTGTGINWIDGSGTGIIGGPYVTIGTAQTITATKTFTADLNVGAATTDGAGIHLIYDPSFPEIRIQAGESGASAFSIYNTATSPDAEQFFINNNLGSSHLGNARGALKLESSSGVVLTLSGNASTFAGQVTANGAVIANSGITGLDIAGGISGNNYNITGVNQLTINDPGEGIVFSGTTNVQLFTIDDATDSILKVTSATALDVNAKITNLSPGSANLDAVNYQQLTDAVAGVLVYQGTWNASTNSPALASGVGTPGYYYIVSTPGGTNLDGITDWNTGDWVIFSDQATDAWQKIDHTNVLNGAGTGNQVTKWSGAGTSYALTDSSITDNGTSVGIGTTLPGAAYKLEVNGLLKANGGFFTNPVNIFDTSATENPRLSLGRGGGESLNFDVEDRNATIYHKQDETTGIHKLSLSVDSDSVDTNTIDFNFRNSAGTTITSTPMTILSSGEVNISGSLTFTGNGIGSLTAGDGLDEISLNVADVNDGGNPDNFNLTLDGNGQGTFYTKLLELGDGEGVENGTNIIIDSTNSKILLDNGNVGIGTTSPQTLLNIESTTAPTLRISNGGGTSPAPKLEFYRQAGVSSYIQYDVANKILVTDNAHASGVINYKINGSEKMRITSSGNVGIGVTSPISKLQVGGKIRATELEVSGNILANATNATVNIGSTISSTPTYGYPNTLAGTLIVGGYTNGGYSYQPGVMTLINQSSSITAGTDLGVIQFAGQTSDSSGYVSTIIKAFTAASAGSGQSGGGIVTISTTPTGYGSPIERFRINDSGKVGIGVTAPSQKLHVDGNARVTGAYYDSNNSPGTSGQILSSTVTGADWIDNAHIPSPAPTTPGSIVSTIVGQTIEVEFDESTTSNIDYYQVWSSDDGGDYGIIAQIPPTDFSATMTVVDTSFSTGGTMSYRIYAVKSGVYSSPGTTSKTYTVGALDVTDMTVINLNTAYYIQYEKPASRFIDHIEIYMDSQTTQGALNRSNASIIYSGQNTSFMKSVGVSNNFHQFWVEVVTT